MPQRPPVGADRWQVRVLLFGVLRDRLGRHDVVVTDQVGTVAQLWDAVTAGHPEVGSARESTLCARNLEYCSWDTEVRAGDEVAFMPPVSGGADRPGVAVTLTETPIDVGAMLASAGGEADGAVACFVGRVRNHSEGQAVHLLEYEAYAPMALTEMRRIADAAQSRHALTTVCVTHRTGALTVGDVAVAVVTASAHRDAALQACREVIDAVKAHVPIWKREHTADGAHWVDARC